MTTARQKVLTYLSKAGTASAREIARGLRLSPATVRHHLRILVSDGRLELASLRGRDSRGRPENLYSLPRAALGHNLAALSEALLEEAGATLRPQSLAGRLARGSELAGRPLVKRLNLSVEKLNAMNYHAHWEAGAEGPRLIFGHCPYAAIVGRHPALCRMDQALLEELTGQPALQIFKAGIEGSSLCVFVMGNK